MHKYYLCLTYGKAEHDFDREDFLLKDSKNNKVQIFSEPRPEAKKIHTRGRVLGCNADYSEWELELLTGKSHQLRAHMAYLGYPLVGDPKYAANKTAGKAGKTFGQALVAYRVVFPEVSGDFSYLSRKEFRIEPPVAYQKIRKDCHL